jgi:hypothetical protein
VKCTIYGVLLVSALGLPPIFRRESMEMKLHKLISEYDAIERIDRIIPPGDRRHKTESIGLRVRELRRREILAELSQWIIATENLLTGLQGQEEDSS